jgi:SAM-dependent methyltransferase
LKVFPVRENDIRPEKILNEYLRLSAEDAKTLFGNLSAFEQRNCPGCESQNNNKIFEKNGFNLVTCSKCHSLFVNPAPTEAALTKLYSDSESAEYWAKVFFPTVAEVRREAIFHPRAASILSLIAEINGKTEVIIDVGAGAGILIEELRKLSPASHIKAVEPGHDHLTVLAKKSIDVFDGYAMDAALDLNWAATADAVICCEVIEHVADTASFVSSLAALAKPGGLIIMTGLCGGGFDIKVLGEHSKAVSPPHHLNFLSQLGVGKLIDRTGLHLVSFTTPGELDVDIVCNTLHENNDIQIAPFLRELIQDGDDALRENFQKFLKENQLSSHMWIIARKPD